MIAGNNFDFSFEACDCVYNLHDPNLCSPDANCPNTGNEFTFERRADNMCYAIINCPANSKIAVRYSSGISQRDIPLQDFRNTHNIACTANKWTVYDATNTARDITHIVCQIPKAREPVCSICSSSAIQAIERGCFPDDFYCTRAQIESTFNASSGCTDLSIKCPGDQIQLTLDAGSTVIAYSNEVRCDGGWNLIDDNLVSHRIVSMKCLNNEIKIGEKELITGLRPYLSDKLTGECSCAQPVQDATEVRERFAVNDTLTMMCANDKWLIKEEEKQIHLQQNDVLSCTVSSEISSNSTASSE
ncbi:hypothetical protein Q1695_003391 [Nippostrongylus brasiliensis]|nr:hypothetical protein Q1695_003391 [Nippostrongylus brasiliensis]